MMIKWLKERSTQEKWMIALAVMLLVGIVVRWTWISGEVSEAIRERFTTPATQTTPPDSLP